MKVFYPFILALIVFTGCNPDDDNTPPPNPTSLPDWESVGELYGLLSGGAYGNITCMEIYNGELYIGGGFSAVQGVVAKNIAKWDGINWSPVNGSSAETSAPISMKVFNSELYVIYGNNFVVPQKWDGSNWSNVDSLQLNTTTNTSNNDLAVFNGLIYYGNGSFDGTNATTLVPYINGTGWADTFCVSPYSYCIFNNELYCSGKFNYQINNDLYGICKWINNEWVNVAGQTISNPIIYKMAKFNNEMYVFGTFNSLGGQVINNLAKWNGSSWQPVPGITSSWAGYFYADNSHIYLSPANNFILESSSFNFDASNNPDSAFSNVVRYDGSNWEYVTDSARTKSVFGPIIMYNSYLYAETMDENNIVSIVRVQPQ